MLRFILTGYSATSLLGTCFSGWLCLHAPNAHLLGEMQTITICLAMLTFACMGLLMVQIEHETR